MDLENMNKVKPFDAKTINTKKHNKYREEKREKKKEAMKIIFQMKKSFKLLTENEQTTIIAYITTKDIENENKTKPVLQMINQIMILRSIDIETYKNLPQFFNETMFPRVDPGTQEKEKYKNQQQHGIPLSNETFEYMDFINKYYEVICPILINFEQFVTLNHKDLESCFKQKKRSDNLVISIPNRSVIQKKKQIEKSEKQKVEKNLWKCINFIHVLSLTYNNFSYNRKLEIIPIFLRTHALMMGIIIKLDGFYDPTKYPFCLITVSSKFQGIFNTEYQGYIYRLYLMIEDLENDDGYMKQFKLKKPQFVKQIGIELKKRQKEFERMKNESMEQIIQKAKNIKKEEEEIENNIE